MNNNQLMLQDDFVCGTQTTGSIGQLGWSCGAGIITVAGGSATNPGIYRLATGPVAGIIARLTLNTSALLSLLNEHELVWIARLNTNDMQVAVRYGLGSSPSAAVFSDGIYFEKLETDTNWFCVTRSKGIQTRTDTGIAVTNAMTRVSYVRSTTDVKFFVGDILVATHTTNLPSVMGTPFIQIFTTTSTDKHLDVDYFEMSMNGVAR